jgi:hypothetical protein
MNDSTVIEKERLEKGKAGENIKIKCDQAQMDRLIA